MAKKFNKKTVIEVPEISNSSNCLNLSDFASMVKKEIGRINPDIVSDPNKVIQFITSGNFSFDLVNGGWPRRRISEIFGMEHSGKSSMVYQTFAELQRVGKFGILFDYEGSWEPTYAKNTFGLIEDGKTFLVLQPDTVEEGDLIFERMQNLSQIDLIVIDSIDAMKPQALIECSLAKDAKIGAHAMAVGRVVAKFKRFARLHNTAVVFTNQIRSKINIQL
jgi:recombination protein RecA